MDDASVKQNHLADDKALLALVKQRETSLQSLERELDATQRAIESLLIQQPRYQSLVDACRSLEELASAGGSELLWRDQDPADYLHGARQQIDKYEEAIRASERRREDLLASIGNEELRLEYLRLDLAEAREQEELRANAWIIEREPGALPPQQIVMPWARSGQEDTHFRVSLVLAIVAAVALSVLAGMIAIPAAERPQQIRLPERVARLVREERQPPAPPPRPIEEPVPEEALPEPEPDTEQTPREDLEPREEPTVTVPSEQEVKEKVKSKGILAFRDSIASRATLRTAAQLGSQARIRAIDDDAIDRPQRSMIGTNAPSLGSDINLGDISRDVGRAGTVADVEVARVASSIETVGATARPRQNAALAGRTDEDIQIVFDRYKASLYRLYNRELRRDPRLRGQMVIRLTIEPDGAVSSCAVQSSTLQAPGLEAQVVERVRAFDFGAKEGVDAITIVYPIDFMPAT
ncbi:MAG: TonB family protein [Gammaproteobacteria bacterium]|nr:TonB family protein [Gammaproteobacteria bacterium]